MSPAAEDIPVFDLRGLRCPLPVLKSRKRMDAMAPGALLWIETTDPLAGIDIPAFLNEAGHRLVETVRAEWGYRFLAERSGALNPSQDSDLPSEGR